MLKIISLENDVLICSCILLLISLQVHSSRCLKENLPLGVDILGVCKFRIQESCNASCAYDGITLWEKQVRCLENGKWSSLPICEHIYTKRSLEPIDCSQLPVAVRKEAYCMKLKAPISLKCPELSQLNIDLANCTRNINSNCIITCGKLFQNITCLPNGAWSEVPSCTSSLRKNHCPEPDVGKLVNCSRREGELCKIQCPGGKLMKESIICLPSGLWELASLNFYTREIHAVSPRNASNWRYISKCLCPIPKVPKGFKLPKNCANTKIGKDCPLACQANFAMMGNNKITCLENITWSAFPVCTNKRCPAPKLPNMLAFRNGPCKQKLPKQNCPVKCKGQARMILTTSFICIDGTKWAKFPSCVCLPPKLPKNMKIVGKCDRIPVGKACRIKCNGKADVKNIRCLVDGKWSNFPKCT